MTMPFPTLPATGPSWRTHPFHREWLRTQANHLFDFFQRRSINPAGGFFNLDTEGQRLEGDNAVRQIHSTTRMVHCFSIGMLLGRPGCDALVDHGMHYLWNNHRDTQHGGYVWSLDDEGPKDDTKQAYGHAFVLLAASSAKVVGHPLADRLLADISQVLEERFWEDQHGAVSEEYARDWSPISQYRGQNSNMHLTEALMAAFEATGDRLYLDRAERIADLIIGRHAASLNYRVAEHFHADWSLDREYRGYEMFRPYGTTPGHWLEWSRLLLQLWALGGNRHDWMPHAARELFRQSIELGWDREKGGFFYSLDWDDRPRLPHKLWWPCAEAIGAAAFLIEHGLSEFPETWYRHVWGFVDRHVIDHTHGGWHPELSEDLTPSSTLFTGKPDLYHALQACLIPLFPATGSLTKVISEANARADKAALNMA